MPIPQQTRDTCPPLQVESGNSSDHPPDDGGFDSPLSRADYYDGCAALDVEGQETGWSLQVDFWVEGVFTSPPANDAPRRPRHARRREARAAKKAAKKTGSDPVRIDFDKVRVPLPPRREGEEKAADALSNAADALSSAAEPSTCSVLGGADAAEVEVGVTVSLAGLKAGSEVACPVDGHDGTMFIVREGRQAYCTCTDARVNYVPDKLGRTPDSLQAHVVLRAHDLDEGMYIPRQAGFGEGSLGFKAGMGTGKTEWGAAERARAKKNGATRIVAVASIRSLVGGLARRWELSDYRKIDGDIWSGAVCLNSLRRVHLWNRATEQPLPPIDLLMLDETESLLQALVVGAMGDAEAQAVMRHLCMMIRTAKRVIVMDAHLSSYSVNFINALRPHDPLRIIKVDVAQPWVYRLTKDEAAWHGEVKAACMRRERLAIPMNSKKAGERTAEMVSDWWPEARVLVLNSTTVLTKDEEGNPKYDLADFDWVTDYDVVIYSPSLASGASIDVDGHFERIFAHFKANILTAQGCHQMVHRVRKPRSMEIVIYVEDRRSYLPDDPDVIREEIIATGKHTLHMATEKGLHHTYRYDGVRWDDGGYRTDHEARAYLDHYSKTVAYQRRHGIRGPAEAFRRLLDATSLEQPWMESVVDLADEERTVVREDRNAATATSKVKAREAVLSAQAVSIHEAREREPSTPDQVFENQRAHLVDFYLPQGEDLPGSYCQPDKDDPDGDPLFAHKLLVHDEKRGRDKTRALADLLLLQNDPEAAARVLLGKDWRGYTHGQSIAGLQHRHQRAVITNEVLGWYGVAPTDAILCPEKARAAAKLAVQHKAELRLWGFTVKSNVEKEPFGFLSHVLSKLGLGLVSKQRRDSTQAEEKEKEKKEKKEKEEKEKEKKKGSPQVRDKWLNLDKLNLGLQLARAELARLQAAAEDDAEAVAASPEQPLSILSGAGVTPLLLIEEHWSGVTPAEHDEPTHDEDSNAPQTAAADDFYAEMAGVA